ncbi:MAG: Cu(I)/Ag(I) efflux system membrane fusion protein [Limisphaerales bacterium]|jgi:Cu(I)/Ag(I) efflux system membrane fusion protein
MNKRIKIVLVVLAVLASGVIIGRWSTQGTTNPKVVENEIGHSIWTCSMDPQIKKDEPGSCPICGMDLIPLIVEGSNDALDIDAIKMSDRALALADVQTMVVGRYLAEDNDLKLSGRIEIDESRVYNQTAHFSGRVENLYVSTEGEYVKRAQKIARLYSPELVTAQEELFEAKKLDQDNLVESVRKKLKLWKLSEEEIELIESSGKVRTEIDVLADVEGIVISKLVNVGSHVMEGSVLYQVVDLSKVWVVFDVYEKDLGSVRIGDEIVFNVAAFPAKELKGKISFINPAVDPQTRTTGVRIEVSNSSQKLKPDMLASGVLKGISSKPSHGLLVPSSSVLWTGKRSIVYVRAEDSSNHVFTMREVVLGEKQGSSYIVHSGLSDGEEIVINGTFTVDAAAQLQGKKSMMNQESTSQPSTQTHNH